jgi:hypothetical protein
MEVFFVVIGVGRYGGVEDYYPERMVLSRRYHMITS